MSEVLIKGVKMPKSCDECFVYKSICPATAKRNKALGDDVVPKNHRHSDCPLINIPSHGRLIDADALTTYPKPIGKLMMFGGEYVYTQTAIDDAPTIIEASV